MCLWCYCGGNLDHFSGDGNLLADLVVVVMDHPGNEGDVVHQVIGGHHNLSLRHWSRMKHLKKHLVSFAFPSPKGAPHAHCCTLASNAHSHLIRIFSHLIRIC